MSESSIVFTKKMSASDYIEYDDDKEEDEHTNTDDSYQDSAITEDWITLREKIQALDLILIRNIEYKIKSLAGYQIGSMFLSVSTEIQERLGIVVDSQLLKLPNLESGGLYLLTHDVLEGKIYLTMQSLDILAATSTITCYLSKREIDPDKKRAHQENLCSEIQRVKITAQPKKKKKKSVSCISKQNSEKVEVQTEYLFQRNNGIYICHLQDSEIIDGNSLICSIYQNLGISDVENIMCGDYDNLYYDKVTAYIPS